MGNNWTIGGGDGPEAVGGTADTLAVVSAEGVILLPMNGKESTASWRNM